MRIIQRHEIAGPLKGASLTADLSKWTRSLTDVAVATCEEIGWQAAAKGHTLKLLPEPRDEYLTADVMAFADGQGRWRFPIAVMELENSPKDDRIAYSLWKVLCIRAELRVVFCYREQLDRGSGLVSFLAREVVGAMSIEERMAVGGETLVVIGVRGVAETVPYGFFRWYRLDLNLSKFEMMM